MQVDVRPNTETTYQADSLRQAYSTVVLAMCKNDPTANFQHRQIKGMCYIPAVVNTVMGRNTNGSTETNFAYAQQSSTWFNTVFSDNQLGSVISQKERDPQTGEIILGDLEVDLARALRAVSAAWYKHNGENDLRPVFEANSATALIKGLVHEQLNSIDGVIDEKKAAEHTGLTLDKFKEEKAKAKNVANWFAEFSTSR